MSSIIGRRGTAALLILAIAAGPALANFGLINISPEEFAAAPTWQPSASSYGDIPRIDLRRFLPAIGDQGDQQSCTGWAVAYACKSYLEVLDQGWRANHPSRQFSAAFVYNQLNGGHDLGSRIDFALTLLKTRGCATLATMPYSDLDYRRQPSRAALAEAAKFRCSGYYALRSGPEIRTALQQRHVVVLGLYTDPVFTSGRYDIFTAAHRARGDRLRNPRKPHTYHAIVAVGYDDTRDAFLLMNSWGPRWGKQGCCWVDYGLMKQVLPTTQHFVQQAWVLQDMRWKISDPVRPTPTIDKNVALRAYASYTGYRNNQHTWTWAANIVGSQRALASVRRVVYSLPGGGGRTKEYIGTLAASGFQVGHTASGHGPMPISAVVHFTDGTAKPLTFRLALTPPGSKQRALSLIQTDRYWGREANQPNWEWTVQLRGDLVDLADVRQVTYHLHPTFRPPNRAVTGTPRNGFAYTTRGWGTFPVGATVHFRDGSTLPLKVQLNFRDPVRDQLTLTNTSRLSGRRGNDVYYAWTAYVDGPLSLLSQIKLVRYHLHPTFRPNIRDVNEGAEYGFPLSTEGWGVFDIGATVYFQNGATQQLTHRLKFGR